MEIKQKAKQLLELRKEANFVKEQLDRIKFKRDEIQRSLMEEMKQEEFNSVKVDDTMISLTVRKTLQIVNEKELMTDLKKRGLDDYVKEAVDRDLWKGLSSELIKRNETMNGLEIKETEFVSIRNNKK